MFFSGPFTFAPGDTQWTLIALHPAASIKPSDAIIAVRRNAARLLNIPYEQIATAQTTSALERAESLPSSPQLCQNYPNPFNPNSEIRYQISEFRIVRLSVYDLLGREVSVLVNEKKAPGMYQVKFDGSNLASGVYFYRLQVRPLDSAIGRDSKSGAGDFFQAKKMMLMR